MEDEIDKKLKDVLNINKKKKIADLKVKVGIYAGRRGPYKLYKVKGGQVIAVKSRKRVKGGATEEEINNLAVENETYKLPDLDDHQFDELDASMMEEERSDKKLLADEGKVSTVEITKKKRAQSDKQKEWMEYVARIAMLPEMAGKSRAFVMKEAARRRKI